MNALVDAVVDSMHRIADIERRMQNRKRTGLVVQVDPERGLARVKLSTDEATGREFLTGWIPWKETSMGSIRTHFPPSLGEQVDVVSENGDLTDATITQSLPSDAKPRPHNKGDEGVVTVGDTRIHFTGADVTIRSPKIHFNP